MFRTPEVHGNDQTDTTPGTQCLYPEVNMLVFLDPGRSSDAHELSPKKGSRVRSTMEQKPEHSGVRLLGKCKGTWRLDVSVLYWLFTVKFDDIGTN